MVAPAANGKAYPPAAPSSAHNMNVRPQRRRKSSSLGADPRGDTGTGSIATHLPQHSSTPQDSPPRSKSSKSSSASTSHHARERKRTKLRKGFRRFRRTCYKHTWLLPLLIMLGTVGLYYLTGPGESNPLYPFLFLSYANPPLNERTDTIPAHVGDVTQYGKGPKDFCFVAFYTVVFTFTREFLMQRFIKPVALYCGIRKSGKQSRFLEQFYTAVYFAIAGPVGLYVLSRTPVWFFNVEGMYEGFPHRAHEAWFKAYYLLQASYWAQQGLVLVLLLEKPRKDFKELVLHHIVTLALIGLSYRFHFTYMGVPVYITHDISDFFLATSKLLNYISSPITPFYFASFLGIWAYCRHYLNLVIIKSLLLPGHIPFTSIPTGQFATVGPYDLNWITQQYKCWISHGITFSLLAILQIINLFWFFLICRILWRYLATGVEKDERSDDEEEDEEIDEVEGAPPTNAAGKPALEVNGEPVTPSEVPATGVESKGKEDVVRRK
ncbi:hypothetical protein D0867_15611 [Hortaea werneckii]|uniref:TLC domain-containing protein n=1 Tax=Hortaea werneckii TaxID=91943 RepID=A0A3M6XAG7_HORWE|nr:acyl-CoA-dependent ceramide synthase [Hortaea werneckii]RMX87845.1 hypothetical protein D0867_15611 [Hortaea werneckii]RMY33170.1 hypothetical protein D0866_06106 [Hortaea werneckii]